MDIRGDAYGMLAAHPQAPLVSLHHLDHIEPISPVGHTALSAVRPLMDASRFDSARLLQQAFCYQHGVDYTWSVSIAWGYTVQVYPWAVAPHELEVPLQTFKTWRTWANGPFVFNTRPLFGPDNPCYRPAIFFLSRVRNETGRATVSEYSRHHPKSEKECDKASFRAASTVHTVKVFAPKMSQNEWKRVSTKDTTCISKIFMPSTLIYSIRIGTHVSGTTTALLQNKEDEVGHGARGADTILRPRRAHHPVAPSSFAARLPVLHRTEGRVPLWQCDNNGMAKVNNPLRARRDTENSFSLDRTFLLARDRWTSVSVSRWLTI